MPLSINELTFGVEIECYIPEGATSTQAAIAVKRRLQRPVNVERYNHQRRPDWKVTTDGSLGDYARGLEFVSPILRGEEGLQEVEQVCEALQDFGCTVNKKCGLHVHVGVAGSDLDFFKTITKLYATYEPVIDSFMPGSRRESQNAYCRSMTTLSRARIEEATTLPAVISAATSASPGSESRYYKLNLAAYNRHQTVEFRQHSATLEGRKVRNWTTLCLRMVAAAKNGVNLNPRAETAQVVNRARPGSNAHLIGEMLLRPEGVTRQEALRATGWPSISIPQQAGFCGMQVTSQRTGREVRYFAQRAALETAPALDVSIRGLCTLIGATDSEREYFEARARNLSGPIAWAA